MEAIELDRFVSAAPATAPSGLSCCGDLEWGAHFCHLYETRQDLIDTLVPFFSAGIAHNERCLWVTSEPLNAVDATAALAQQIPNLPSLLKDGQIQIVDYSDWYTPVGEMEADSALQGWLDAEVQALAEGFSGLRVTGNITFIKSREEWCAFEQYERRVTESFAGRRIIALCSYHLGMVSGTDVLDVVHNHNFAVARRKGDWEMIENAATKLAKQELLKANEKLEQHVAARTADLRNALATVEEKKRELETALQMRDEGQDQLEAELADAKLVHSISAALINEGVVGDFYQKLVDAAALVMRSDFATMQRFDREREALHLIAHRGFDEDAQAFWEWVPPQRPTSCGMSLNQRERVIVRDFEKWEYSAGEDLAAFRAGGVASAQSTPLLTRNGTLVGMISTHWKCPHEPSERDLRLMDIIARQAADMIERNMAAEALQAQAARLQEADRRKDEFLAMLAHELRNPLAPISSAAQILRIAAGDERRVKQSSEIISRQVKHMTALVDDLLDVSRVTRGLIEFHKVNVSIKTVINSAIEQARPLIESRNHALTTRLGSTDAVVYGDRTRLVQVLANLLNNAAKYTPQNGDITLAVEVLETHVKVSVSDNGIGIKPSLLPHVFDLFTQAERSPDRSQGGLGLGLALVKSIINLHDGQADAQSHGPGKGSAFTVTLPISDRIERMQAVNEKKSEARSSRPRRVTVVDDNLDAAEMLAAVLEAKGHQVAVAGNGKQALEVAGSFNPEIFILDIGLPDIDGYELARRLRTTPAFSRTTMVALTGYGQDNDRSLSKDAGFDRHFVKPVEIDALLKLFDELPMNCEQ